MRRIGAFAVLLACALSCASAAAQQQARSDGVYAATLVARPSARTVEIVFGSSVAHARLRERMPAPRSQVLASTDNANRTYAFTVSYRMTRCPPNTVLIAGGSPAPAPSSSIGHGECRYDFTVDRAAADRIALAFRVARQDRSSIATRVVGRFSTARTAYRRGEPIDVRVTMTNPTGAAAVQREVGCNRFTFVIYRDGHRVAELAPAAQACPVGFTPHASGASAEDSVDVRAWGNIDAPGRYRFECRYTTRFALPGAATYGSRDGSARVWDRVFTGSVVVDVR